MLNWNRTGNRMTKERVVSKLKQVRGISMREKIVETAERYFCEKGYFAATSRKLADAAGISIGSFYFYFKDKEELLLEVYRKQSGRFIITVAAAYENTGLYKTDRREWLGTFIRQLLETYGNSGKLRAELKAVTWKNSYIAEQKAIIKKETVAAMMQLFTTSPVLDDVHVHHPDVALLFVIDIMDAAYERIAAGGTPEEREAVIQECTDLLYRYLFSRCD
ncbi:MAG: TetR/AcrR family transcriptional regulator [Treponema sp.]|nr:TetR/AcrR family transcriptional regulator [Treponema sp.]